MVRLCNDCSAQLSTRKGKGRQRERCDACRRTRHVVQARESKRRRNPGWEARRRASNERYADRFWLAELRAFFVGDVGQQADKGWMVTRLGRTRVSLAHADEEVLEELLHEPGLHPVHIQEHEQEQNDFYARQDARSMLELLMRPADPAQVTTPGGWTDTGTQYGNGATFGQRSDLSPAFHAVMAVCGNEVRAVAGGRATVDAAIAVVQIRAGVIDERLRRRFGDGIARVQAMTPADPRSVDPKARDMVAALVELHRSESRGENA